ncbi:MAG: 6-bladed beta-propeller [Bacteroidota bacterium]
MNFEKKTIRNVFSLTALAIAIIWLSACNHKSVIKYGPNTFHVNENNLKNIDIDPADGKKTNATSSFLDSVEYLPLQTVPGSSFAEISQLEVTANSYIIWDNISNSIFFFDKKGKFQSRISNKDKNVKIPYKKIYHFAVNETKNELMFDDQHSFLIYYYNLKGEFLRTVEKPKYLGPAYTTVGRFNIYYQAFNDSWLRSINQPPCNIVVVDSKAVSSNPDMKLYLPYDSTIVKYYDIFATDQYFYDNHHNGMNFTAPYDYNIYKIDSLVTISNSYRINLPDVYTLPADFMTNSRYNGKREKYVTSNGEIIYGVTDFYQSGNNITFRLYGYNYSQAFVYNLKSKTLQSLAHYLSDKTTHMLPFGGRKIYSIDINNRLISSLPAAKLFALKMKHTGDKKWDATLPVPLKKFFQSNIQQNPVLTFLSVKQNI